MTISKVGTYASVVCAIHCMALPILISVLPMVGMGFMLNETFEWVMLGSAILLSLGGLCWGYRVHRTKKPFFLLAAGILLFLTAHHLQGPFSWILPAFGGTCFAVSNYINHRLCKHCSHCDHG